MAYEDPLDAARRRLMPDITGRSFFPAVNQRLFDDRTDLLKDTENTFYGGGSAPPAPTPTPTPRPRSYFGFNFGPSMQSQTTVRSPSYSSPTPNLGFGINRQPNYWEDWHKQYGFNF